MCLSGLQEHSMRTDFTQAKYPIHIRNKKYTIKVKNNLKETPSHCIFISINFWTLPFASLVLQVWNSRVINPSHTQSANYQTFWSILPLNPKWEQEREHCQWAKADATEWKFAFWGSHLASTREEVVQGMKIIQRKAEWKNKDKGWCHLSSHITSFNF